MSGNNIYSNSEFSKCFAKYFSTYPELPAMIILFDHGFTFLRSQTLPQSGLAYPNSQHLTYIIYLYPPGFN